MDSMHICMNYDEISNPLKPYDSLWLISVLEWAYPSSPMGVVSGLVNAKLRRNSAQ